MEKYNAVIWAHHGMFCSGETFDLTFGLMHTIEKSAEILIKVLSMVPQKRQTISPDNFRKLEKGFHYYTAGEIPVREIEKNTIQPIDFLEIYNIISFVN